MQFIKLCLNPYIPSKISVKQIFTEPTLSDSDFQQILDVKGLRCPMPMLRTKKALAKMQPGEKLLVQATDPHALRDLSQFADQTGNKLLSSSEEDGIINIVMQRKEE